MLRARTTYAPGCPPWRRSAERSTPASFPRPGAPTTRESSRSWIDVVPCASAEPLADGGNLVGVHPAPCRDRCVRRPSSHAAYTGRMVDVHDRRPLRRDPRLEET